MYESSVYRDDVDIKEGLVVVVRLRSIELRSIKLKHEKNRKVINFVAFGLVLFDLQIKISIL